MCKPRREVQPIFWAEGASAPQLPADWSPTRPWYRSIGQGRGAALNTASASNAYVLAIAYHKIEGQQLRFPNANQGGITCMAGS